MYTSGKTKSAMQTVAAASLFSLVQTELIRMRLAKAGGTCKVLTNAPLAPQMISNFGALPGAAPAYQNAPAGAWANR